MRRIRCSPIPTHRNLLWRLTEIVVKHEQRRSSKSYTMIGSKHRKKKMRENFSSSQTYSCEGPVLLQTYALQICVTFVTRKSAEIIHLTDDWRHFGELTPSSNHSMMLFFTAQNIQYEFIRQYRTPDGWSVAYTTLEDKSHIQLLFRHCKTDFEISSQASLNTQCWWQLQLVEADSGAIWSILKTAYAPQLSLSCFDQVCTSCDCSTPNTTYLSEATRAQNHSRTSKFRKHLGPSFGSSHPSTSPLPYILATASQWTLPQKNTSPSSSSSPHKSLLSFANWIKNTRVVTLATRSKWKRGKLVSRSPALFVLARGSWSLWNLQWRKERGAWSLKERRRRGSHERRDHLTWTTLVNKQHESNEREEERRVVVTVVVVVAPVMLDARE